MKKISSHKMESGFLSYGPLGVGCDFASCGM